MHAFYAKRKTKLLTVIIGNFWNLKVSDWRKQKTLSPIEFMLLGTPFSFVRFTSKCHLIKIPHRSSIDSRINRGYAHHQIYGHAAYTRHKIFLHVKRAHVRKKINKTIWNKKKMLWWYIFMCLSSSCFVEWL